MLGRRTVDTPGPSARRHVHAVLVKTQMYDCVGVGLAKTALSLHCTRGKMAWKRRGTPERMTNRTWGIDGSKVEGRQGFTAHRHGYRRAAKDTAAACNGGKKKS